MRLQDDGNVNHIAPHAGKFMYMHQYKKFPDIKSNKKKFTFLNSNNLFSDEEPIEFNDLDLNMLNRNMIKFLPTDALRLELMLERAEKKLKIINEEIITARVLGLDEPLQEDFLRKKKKQLIKEICLYKREYRGLGFFYNLADIISDLKHMFKLIFNRIRNFFASNLLIKIIFEKLPYNSDCKNKENLEKLNMLYKKICRELNKSPNVDPQKLEKLFIKTEELRSQNLK